MPIAVIEPDADPQRKKEKDGKAAVEGDEGEEKKEEPKADEKKEEGKDEEKKVEETKKDDVADAAGGDDDDDLDTEKVSILDPIAYELRSSYNTPNIRTTYYGMTGDIEETKTPSQKLSQKTHKKGKKAKKTKIARSDTLSHH